MAKTPNLIVSVESRKGGVGKTTAALCLACLLRRLDYSVLVMDLDVTGTNAADIAESPFWERDLHVIKEKVGRGERSNSELQPVNLLTLFDKCFMNGKVIPAFSTQSSSEPDMYVDLAKVNVLGSQIYKTDQDDNKDNKVACIERPGILFDDLHALWLLEFVKQITNNFGRVARNGQYAKTAIILDNSPGYVGIAPAIHEWLTDRGPECSKFLTVTSLDVQDLHACELSVQALHDLYKGKWETSRMFIDARKLGNSIEVGKMHEAFFMRLAAVDKGSSGDNDPVAFYRITKQNKSQQQGGNGQSFCDHPEKYIAAIINRVPRAIKTGLLVYKVPEWVRQASTLGQLLGVNRQETEWRNRMIYYDEYIENQFLLQSLQLRRGRFERQVHQLIDALEMAKEQLRAEMGDPSGFLEIDNEHYEKLRTRLVKANEIVTQARSVVDGAGLGHLAHLIRDEWLSGSIVIDFRSALLRLLRESDFPYFEMMPFEFDRESTDPRAHELMHRLKKEILRDLPHNLSDRKNLESANLLAGTLVALVGLSLTWRVWHFPPEKEISGLFAAVVAIELKHWAKRGEGKSEKLNVQRFLAQESVTWDELKENREMFMHPRFFHSVMEGRGSFADFYKSCTSAQARLIDFAADSMFLLQLLEFIVKGEMENGSLFPFLRGIAEDVIVNKSVNHEEAPSRMAKALRTFEYFREFDGLLKKVLACWGVTRE